MQYLKHSSGAKFPLMEFFLPDLFHVVNSLSTTLKLISPIIVSSTENLDNNVKIWWNVTL